MIPLILTGLGFIPKAITQWTMNDSDACVIWTFIRFATRPPRNRAKLLSWPLRHSEAFWSRCLSFQLWIIHCGALWSIGFVMSLKWYQMAALPSGFQPRLPLAPRIKLRKQNTFVRFSRTIKREQGVFRIDCVTCCVLCMYTPPPPTHPFRLRNSVLFENFVPQKMSLLLPNWRFAWWPAIKRCFSPSLNNSFLLDVSKVKWRIYSSFTPDQLRRRKLRDLRRILSKILTSFFCTGNLNKIQTRFWCHFPL
jgi:hypothetical protein